MKLHYCSNCEYAEIFNDDYGIKRNTQPVGKDDDYLIGTINCPECNYWLCGSVQIDNGTKGEIEFQKERISDYLHPTEPFYIDHENLEELIDIAYRIKLDELERQYGTQ